MIEIIERSYFSGSERVVGVEDTYEAASEKSICLKQVSDTGFFSTRPGQSDSDFFIRLVD